MNYNNRSNQGKCFTSFRVLSDVARPNRVNGREFRDQQQRHCALLRIKSAWKSNTKVYRSRHVAKERDEKYECGYTELEEQGFGLLKPILVSAATLVSAKIASSINRTNKKVNDVIDSVKSFFKELKEKAIKFVGGLWVLPIIALGYWLVARFVGSDVAQTIILSCLAFVFGPALWRKISAWFNPVQAQSGLESDFSKIVATSLCFSFLPKDASKLPQTLMSRFAVVPKATEGIENTFTFVVSLAEKMLNFILTVAGVKDSSGNTRRIAFGDDTTRMIKIWANQSFDFTAKLSLDKPDVVVLKKVEEHLRAGYVILQQVRDSRVQMVMKRHVDALEARLRPFAGALTATRSFRVEPLMLLLYGESGTGKSSLVTKLASTLLLLTGMATPADVLCQMFQKGTSEYWNGYINQKCLVMDDIFQQVTAKGATDTEYMDMIRMVGNWMCPLNMADLESKGKFFFDSEIIVGTTNAPTVHHTTAANAVMHVDAIARRVHTALEMTVNPEFAVPGTRKLNYPMVDALYAANVHQLDAMLEGEGRTATAEEVVSCIPWEAWQVYKIDWSSSTLPNRIRSEPESLRDMVTTLGAELRERKRRYEASLSTLTTYTRLLGAAKAADDKPVVESGLPEIMPCVDWPSDNSSCCDLTSCRSMPYPEVLPTPPPSLSDFDVFEREEKKWDKIKHACRSIADKIMAFARKSVFLSIACGACGFVLVAKLSLFLKSQLADLLGFVSRRISALFGSKLELDTQSNVKDGSKAPPKKFHYAPKPQSYDGSQDNVVPNHVYGNTWKILMGDNTIGQILFIEDRIAVHPLHFTHQIQKRLDNDETTNADKLSLFHAGSSSTMSMTVGQFMSLPRRLYEGCDLAFVQFPREAAMQTPKRITDKFMSEDEMGKVVRAQAPTRLDVLRVTNKKGEVMKSQNTMTSSRLWVQYGLPVGSLTCEMLLKYTMPTEAGDCGAPLMVSQSNKAYSGRVILGVHIAGNRGVERMGFSQPITREMVDDAVRHFGAIKCELTEDLASRGISFEEPNLKTQSALESVGLVSGSFMYLGEVDKPVRLAQSTKLKESPLHELSPFGDCGQSPAHMRSTYVDGELKHPMVEGLKGYQSEVEWREVKGLAAIVQIATHPFRTATIGHTRDILTFEEAVKGPDLLKMKAINRGTSAGYPYVCEVKNGKKEFFGNNDDYEFTSARCLDLRARVSHIIRSAKDNVRLAHICVDFLKDETRPYHKVEKCETRVISGSPLDYAIAVRMYFGAFIAAMFETHTESGMCPGINPYQDWGVLAGKLNSVGPKVFDGDFKGFDKSEQPFLLWAILDFINQWYSDGDVNMRVREVLWLDLVHSRHITGVRGDNRYLVQWNKSLPSGHPLTTPVNSLYSLISLVGCYATEFGSARDYWEKVYTGTYGDDNINAVSDDVADRFNLTTVTNHMRDVFGLTYTSGSKDANDCAPYKTLQECTFLKRAFRHDATSSEEVFGGWIAPLDLKSCLYTSYWHKNDRDLKVELANKLEGTLGELCLHNPSVWKEHAPKVLEVMRDELSTTPIAETREAWLQITKDREDLWF